MKRVTFRDSTLREGLDTPGVAFSVAQRIAIARRLSAAGIREMEVVAPSRVGHDLGIAVRIRKAATGMKLSGLVYASRPQRDEELAQAARVLDRVDVLVPLSPRRPPAGRAAKTRLLRESLEACARLGLRAGAGFPNATQVDPAALVAMAVAAERAGASRVTVYDTNGSATPVAVEALIRRACRRVRIPVHFHGHDDVGLATANSLTAVLAGAAGLDVTVNGLGDRAGNCALEQAAMVLHLHGIATGVRLDALPRLCRAVARASGVAVSPLAPIVGDYVFRHRSPAHLVALRLFEAFDPALVGARRQFVER
jgi:homocitrate synthase NifV